MNSEVELTETLLKYFNQLTVGCGRKPCINEFCAANPICIENPNTAAAKALQLASQKVDQFCPPTPPFLNLQEIEDALEKAKETGEAVLLLRKIGTVFSVSESLNMSFLKTSPDTDYTCIDSVDTDAAKQAFRAVLNCDIEPVKNSLNMAVERLGQSLRVSGPTITHEYQLRQFVILLESPMLSDSNVLLEGIASALTQIPDFLQQTLINFLSGYSKDKFLFLLSTFQQFVALPLVISPVASMAHISESGVKFLALLHKINEIANYVQPADFYNSIVSEKLDVRDEYRALSTGDYFSFALTAPFLLTPEKKSFILELQNKVTMLTWKRDAVMAQRMPYVFLQLTREDIIPVTLDQLSYYQGDDFKGALRVQFVGEEGIDEGGVSKEFFQLILKNIFHEQFGMFKHNEENQTYWFNPASTDLEEFKLIGIVLGLAIFNAVVLDIRFPPVLYKKLKNLPIVFEDLHGYSPTISNNLQKILDYEGDLKNDLDLVFEGEYQKYDETVIIPLIEGGGEINVTQENKKEYVNLYTKFLLETSVQQQFDAFCNGFKLVCNATAFNIFTPPEIELLLCGTQELDFFALEEATKYEEPFSKDHAVIKLFWEIVHELSEEEKKKVLLFVTGSDRAPIGGLANLTFVISKNGDTVGNTVRLPSSHTCFNHLLLPDYPTKFLMKAALRVAIDETEG